MPGRGSYGPGGKWIYTRAKKLRAKNPDMEEGASYAIATQQAHKVGKSPKGFRTPQGVATAKAKMTRPVKEYRKTAGAEEAMAKRLKTLISLRDKGYASEREIKEIPWLRDQLGEGGHVKEAMLAGMFDELEKVASLAAAARFGVGVLLGSLLWNALGGDQKKELKDKAERVIGEKSAEVDPLAQARKKFKQTRRVGELGTKKPPEPNIRAVATEI